MHDRRLGAGLVLAGLLGAGCRQFGTAPSQVTKSSGPLAAFAQQSSLAPLGKTVIVASGGWKPYTFAFEAPGAASGASASLDPSGDYRAGPIGPVQDRIAVSDSDGGYLSLTINVGLPLSLTPSSAAVNPGAPLVFTAQGGQLPYSFTLASPCRLPDAGSTSTLDAGDTTALYVAGTGCANVQDAISVEDTNGAVAGPALVTIGSGVTVFPSQASVVPGQTVPFAASGGVAPYSFSFARHGNLSGGAISRDGTYQAGVNPTETDLILVTDSNGLTGQAQVAVGNVVIAFSEPEALTLYPASFYDFHPLQSVPTALPTDLLAMADQIEQGVMLLPPPANLLEVFQGTGAGLVPAGSDDLSAAIVQLISPSLLHSAVGDALLEVVTPAGTFLQEYAGAVGGPPAPGASLVLSLSSAEGACTYGPSVAAVETSSADGGGWLVATASGQFPDGGCLVLPDGGSDSVIAFYSLQGGTGGVPGFVPVGQVLEPGLTVPNLVGRGTTLLGTCQDLETLEEQFVIRLDGLSIGPDGGVVIGTNTVSLLPPCSSGTPCLANSPTLGLADLDGDGTQDPYFLSENSDGSFTLQAALTALDAGNAFLPSLHIPSVFELQATPLLGTGGSQADVLDGVGFEPGFRVALEGGQLEIFDAGYPAQTASLAFGDFNGDGLLDLALSSLDGHLTIERGELLGRRGTGDAFAIPSPHVLDLTQENHAQYFAAGDLDGDGAVELLVGLNGVRLFAGAGPGFLSTEGTWELNEPFSSVAATPSGGYGLALPPGGAPYVVWITVGDGGWTEQPSPVGATTTGVEPIALHGSNPGGALLLVGLGTAADGGSTVEVVANDAGTLTSLGAPLTLPVSSNEQIVPLRVTSGPIDDLAVLGGGGFGEGPDGGELAFGQITLYSANPSGSWWSSVPTTAVSASGLQAAGNGDCAMVLSQPLPSVPVPFSPQVGGSATLLVEQGNLELPGGAFGTAVCAFDLTSGTATEVFGVASAISAQGGSVVVAGDVNGDGFTDLIGVGNLQLQVAFGNGSGQFSPPTVLLSHPDLGLFFLEAVGDFDGDGLPDLVFLNSFDYAGPYLAVLHGLSDGGFD